MLEFLSKQVTGATGLGTMARMANAFGLLPPMAELALRGLDYAPKPQMRQLSDDWLQNLDVISHSIGCVLAGVFDGLVDDLSDEEIRLLEPSDIANLAPPGVMRVVLENSFDTCREYYLEYGPLSILIADGVEVNGQLEKLAPEGLVTTSLLAPLRKKQELVKEESGKKNLLGRLMTGKNDSQKESDSLI
jgi:hypothetical protein